MTDNTAQRSGRIRKNRNHLLSFDILPIFREWLNDLPDSPKTSYLKSEVFSKFVSPDTDPADVRKDRAVSKWLATEAVNAETNERLMSTPDEAVLLPSVRFGSFCDKARDFLVGIIGDLPKDPFYGVFSGGATTSRNRTSSHPAEKFVGEAHVTRACFSMLDDKSLEFPVWDLLGFPSLKEVKGNHMFTVPKSTQIDRVACKEPDLNMFFQRGLGIQLRSCLSRVGNDLSDQSRNRKLARKGSIDGSLATLDLSSASDSISYALVELLLPPLWFSALVTVRSPWTLLPSGDWHLCEMFSSMGNGFTFELESLIFLVLARTTAYFTGTKGVVSVYGDDIICPSTLFEPLRHVLFYFGFSLNPDKSFHTGDFRESCGGHYFNGSDITPFFIRRPVDRLTELIHLLNSLRVWAGLDDPPVLDEDCWVIWSLLSELVPRSLKGGYHTTAGKYQLVSPDLPRKRLSPEDSKKVLPVEGEYLQSLNSITERQEVGFLSSEEDKIVHGRCKMIRVDISPFEGTPNLFLSEIVDPGFITSIGLSTETLA